MIRIWMGVHARKGKLGISQVKRRGIQRTKGGACIGNRSAAEREGRVQS